MKKKEQQEEEEEQERRRRKRRRRTRQEFGLSQVFRASIQLEVGREPEIRRIVKLDFIYNFTVVKQSLLYLCQKANIVKGHLVRSNQFETFLY